jgi:hypothetical protein
MWHDLGTMGVVCTIQRVNVVFKNGTAKTMLVRETDCFEKRDGEWQLIPPQVGAARAPLCGGMMEKGHFILGEQHHEKTDIRRPVCARDRVRQLDVNDIPGLG